MKLSKILIAGMLLSPAFSMSAFADVDADTLAKALQWVHSQPGNEQKPAPAPAPAPQKPVQPPVVVTPAPKPAPQPAPAPVPQQPAKPVPPPVVVTPAPAPKPVPQPQPAPQPVPPVVVKPTPAPIPTSLVGYQGPTRTDVKSEADNQALFSQYCIGDASSAAVPQPNYANPEVQKAARIMSKVADINIYFYGDVKRIYKAGAPKPAEQSAVTDNAHLFLVQTCGEFRDRAEMIRGKIRWVNNMVLLGSDPQQPIDPKSTNVWAHVSGQSYMPYLNVSGAVFRARLANAWADTYLSEHLHPDAQKAAPGFTVCETKYILSEYVAAGKSFSSLAEFDSGYQAYESKCGTDAYGRDDREYYYDFRGDSNFKQYSPESNAMLWQVLSIAPFCVSPTQSNGKSAVITDQVCESYFKKPFMTRYNAARAGLGAWLLYSKDEETGFENASMNVTVYPSFDLKNLGVKPFSMKLSDGVVAQNQLSLNDSTLGFNQMFGIGTANADLASAYKRIRNAVNRHTNWYQSAFDDQLGTPKSLRSQAYSPFVASSYEMSASNAFTECGYTVQCTGDGRKAWMFVFKIRKDHWYNTDSLMQNKKIDFDHMWFDETSFGTDSLANSEHAWDRMGTALEDELDTIVYLHNLQAQSGTPVANDQLQ